MSAPPPPCGLHCPHRSISPNCHDPVICPKWGAYIAARAAFCEAITRGRQVENDYSEVRKTNIRKERTHRRRN